MAEERVRVRHGLPCAGIPVVPTACSGCQIVRALRSLLLDMRMLKERVPLYAFVILVALTNMEAMHVLPWRADVGDFDACRSGG